MDDIRREHLLDNWHHETEAPETMEWRVDLTPEGLEFVAQLDGKYNKSEFAAALGLYHLLADGEHIPNVGIFAADKDNASIIYNAAKYMAEHSCLPLRKQPAERTCLPPARARARHEGGKNCPGGSGAVSGVYCRGHVPDRGGIRWGAGTECPLDGEQPGGLRGYLQGRGHSGGAGELARRHMGYEPSPLPSAEDIAATTAPAGLPALKSAIISAIMLGYGREIEPEDDEVDLELAELNEQKNEVTRAHYLRIGALCGFSRKETLLAPPGEIWDVWELYLQAHGGRKKTEDE